MTPRLVDEMKNLFQAQALSDAATELGEPEGSVMRGFQAASAAIFSGLASQAGQQALVRKTFDLMTGPMDPGILTNTRELFSKTSGLAPDGLSSRFLSLLFAGQQERVADKVGRASGLNLRSANALMGVAASMVLGLLGRSVREDHLDVSGLSKMLRREGSGVGRMLPPGLDNVLGNPTAQALNLAPAMPQTTRRWIWPMVALMAAVAIIVFVNRTQRENPQTAGPSGQPVRSRAASITGFLRMPLKNGVELNIPQDGMEARLLDAIRSPSPVGSNNSWFEFDRLTFEPGSATLREQSQEQLTNLAIILRAYPGVHLRLGCYGDDKDSDQNLRLSQQRAQAVVQTLVHMGISPNRLETGGNVEQRPVPDHVTAGGGSGRIMLQVRHN